MAYSIKRDYRDVLVDHIEEGMILETEVVNRYGNILLTAGTELKEIEKIQNLLEQHQIKRVRVKLEEESIEIMNSIIADDRLIDEMEKEEVESFRSNFMDVQKNLQNDFQSIVKGESIKEDGMKKNIMKSLSVFNGRLNIFQLIEKIKDYDDITYAHSQNVTLISYALGKWLNLTEDKLQNLTLSALLTDVGKIQVPVELLNKKEQLTYDEKLECQKHVVYSHELIKKYDFINEEVKKAVLFHHERMDGSGYPMGLTGDKIPLFARLIAIADVYNALTSERPYRPKMTPFNAIKIMEQEYLDKLDAEILYIFLHRIGNCFIGQNVKLSNGNEGRIVFVPKQNIHRPIIKLSNSDLVIDLGASENKDIEILDFT
ncbi:HD-GYP domain-containing protein [Alkaliphilus peptidifermentans]|uniref:HD-GYP domain, c-di-GMP phosphodiesterase class II (Or its inactivated variant) n=1 Tax=Alkaliphilus peptidifermentans DSM 18978 TaxID=1120976 RepID=A0A1G5AND7_9FIRM|nr:HD-GYP domain-containing protein [Alkaliphilus peptidifermentans]SCX79362.1 HD-GYP domain, c-di-GMP phosphodiesterase class II (or its inactivated variant) [Alkaliphilus peptidifermentans DSM 18978]